LVVTHTVVYLRLRLVTGLRILVAYSPRLFYHTHRTLRLLPARLPGLVVYHAVPLHHTRLRLVYGYVRFGYARCGWFTRLVVVPHVATVPVGFVRLVVALHVAVAVGWLRGWLPVTLVGCCHVLPLPGCCYFTVAVRLVTFTHTFTRCYRYTLLRLRLRYVVARLRLI